MKIGVLIKQVPDTATKIKVAPDGSGVDMASISKWIINPFDEFAIEEALKTKEKHAPSEVILFNIGPKRSPSAFDTPLAMGADRAVGVDDPSLENASSLTNAKILAKLIESEEIDLLFAGARGVDDDMYAVPVMVAELLNWPAVNMVGKFELSEDKKAAIAHRKIAGGALEVVEAKLPCIIACDWKMNEPRYASLIGIRRASSKPREMKTLADIGLQAGELPTGLVTNNWALPAERGACKILGGDLTDAVKALTSALRNEAKVL